MTRAKILILFLISLGLLIVGKGGLDVATATIQHGMFRVPDLMGIEIAWTAGDSYLDLLGNHSEVAGFYLRTLWTYDVLFPVGLCGVCFAFIAGGPLPRAFRWLPLLVLAADLGAENVTVTLALQAPASQMAAWETAWQWATTCKWCLTYVTIPCAVVSAVGISVAMCLRVWRIGMHIAHLIIFRASVFLRAARQRFSPAAEREKT